MWVQPKFRRPTFPLKSIRAIGFIIKPEEAEKRRETVCGSQQFFQQFFCSRKKKDDQIIQFLQQKRGSQIICFWVYFYRKVFLFISDSDDSFRVRSSSICLNLRLDMPIIFIHYIWMISLFLGS